VAWYYYEQSRAGPSSLFGATSAHFGKNSVVVRFNALCFVFSVNTLYCAYIRYRILYAHEPGATAVTDWLGIAFSTDWLSTDDLEQDVGEHAQQ